MKRIEWNEETTAKAIRMRQTMKPAQIARKLGTTPQAVEKQLSMVKKSRGLTYPKLKHGNAKSKNNQEIRPFA